MKKLLFYLIIIILNVSFIFMSSSDALDIDSIEVDIKGAVINPGVYTIDINSTVNDLIIKAGGLRSDADTSIINLSKRLKDEDVVIVYTISEVKRLTSGDTAVKVIEKECMCPKISNIACINKKTNLININVASLDELTKLEGIGKSKAQAIIDYREEHLFTSIEEVMNVKGIGKTIYEKIKDSIEI